MRNTLNDNVLTLFFEGELNSYNSENIEKEIEATLEGKEFATLDLDFSHLHYISSAGLRIILKLKQKYNDTHIIEASLEIYDVLNMTGFTNIMDVKKALKRVYISGAEVIGSGYFSTVYRIDKDTIIKVFNRVSDPQQIERELSLAKQAFILGIPTAISYDIVRVDDKLGVRFEMLDCMSLKNAFVNLPDKYDSLVKKYAELLKKINTTECNNLSIPDIKQTTLRKFEKLLKPYVDEKTYQKCVELVSNIPDRNTFVHGDCHFKNIMCQGEELLLIDMDTLSRGHPIFELARLRAPYIAFEELNPGNSEEFFNISADLVTKIYHDLITLYFGKFDQAIEDKIATLCYIHMCLWNRKNEPENMDRFNKAKEKLLALLAKVNDLDLGI